MGAIYDTVRTFFEEDGWPFREIEGEDALDIDFEGENGRWSCLAIAREDAEQFVFYSLLSNDVRDDAKAAVMLFVTQANWGLPIGNFEMDVETGEIRFRTSIDVEGDRLTHALVKQLVYANVALMDRYLPGINAVIGGELPFVAIDAVERA